MLAGPERIDSSQLIELLSMIRGCRRMTITAETVPVLRQRSAAGVLCPWFDVDSKAGQPAGRRFFVRKLSAFSSAAVGKRRRSRAEYFDSGSRTWGKRRRGCPLVDYRGRVFLDVQKLRVLSSRFYDVATGQTVTRAELDPWLSERADSGVKWRDYRLDRVRSVVMNGRAFELVRGQRMKTAAESPASQTERRRALRRPARVRGE